MDNFKLLGKSKPDVLLHLSFNSNLPEILYPRQPDGSDEMSGGKSHYSEELPDRVSFSPTVQTCINAIYPNVSVILDVGREHGGAEFYLYAAMPDRKVEFIDSETVRRNVWDAHITKEVAVLTPIKIKKVAKLLITFPKDRKADWVMGKPFGRPSEKEVLIAPVISYKVLETYSNVNFK